MEREHHGGASGPVGGMAIDGAMEAEEVGVGHDPLYIQSVTATSQPLTICALQHLATLYTRMGYGLASMPILHPRTPGAVVATALQRRPGGGLRCAFWLHS